jgi:hydrogenase nickel incorporation protein HypB
MCTTCGCEHDDSITITRVGDTSVLFKPLQEPWIATGVPAGEQRKIDLNLNILQKNDLQAKHNRYHFESGHQLAINLVSSPGSGKTSLLERTLKDTRDLYKSYVIEGDQQTLNDANRIAATGAEVVQINTGKGCHLDADMVHRAVHRLSPKEGAIIFIENVGNLVCPALFDLGEKERVVVISVTEGDDKPLKYPDMFASATLCIINKIDLLPYVNFNKGRAKAYALSVNPALQFIELSATSGQGMEQWYHWLRERYERLSHTY